MKKPLTCVELFSGAGGLSIGLHQAGFSHKALIELDKSAYKTLHINQSNGFKAYSKADIYNENVLNIKFSNFQNVDLVAGGPPCQPFSSGGKGLGDDDARDMFPQAVKAVAEIVPKAFLFENVKGITRPKFHNYLEYLKLRLEFPHFPISSKSNWENNLKKLQNFKTSFQKNEELSYNVFTHLVNAADFGVPQKRHRFFFIGIRKDLSCKWSFPKQTHSEEALLFDQFVSGEYWSSFNIPFEKESIKIALKRLEYIQSELFPSFKPWNTVRRALITLPDPQSKAAKNLFNHEYRHGARQYPGHTGSVLDQPSKTIKAGNHGVPGGENMMLFPNGKVRYFSTRECARIQTFPDDYYFNGNWPSTVKQLGNAVPVELARKIGRSIYKSLT